MQKYLSNLHRWLGLATAIFLFMAGLTGAIIAWDHELDSWLNPALYESHGSGEPLPAIELARRLEASEPRLQVRYLPLQVEPGHTLSMFVQPRIDKTTNKPYELGYDQVAVDPRTGAVQGRREYAAVSLARLNIIPFLYRLHYTLHLPNVGGFGTGKWLMGMVAIVWFVDGFIALWISFPSWKVWRKSFAFRVKQGSHKLTFDLHRSSGVWTWALLTVLAFTAISMNLGREVVRPVVNAISPLEPLPFDRKVDPNAGEPKLSRADIAALAAKRGRELGITLPVGALSYMPARRLYFTGFFEGSNSHGDWGLGNPRLYFDADTGELVRKLMPGQGSAGELFMQAQFPLHSGRILGTTGRVIITILGLVIAMLSATGVLLWARKKRARASRVAAKSRVSASPLPQPGE
ncbi:MAG: PepSY-associated TM helix domain-containing protein [Polyangiales bacterium]